MISRPNPSGASAASAKVAGGARRGSAFEVFRVFLKLGVSSFGGPIAHIGYFHAECVRRRRWLDEGAYADLVALCQFLPGPASSQVGFSLGLSRAGYPGALAAWSAFTLPSALLLLLFAQGAAALTGTAATGALHGLKLVAVAIVAQAVFGMARTLAVGRERAGIAIAALLIALSLRSSLGQMAAIALGAVLGRVLCKAPVPLAAGPALELPVSRRAGLLALGVYLALLALLPLLAAFSAVPGVPLFNAFYRSGALVFGGGHVVLPLLREAFVPVGWVSDDAFLAGYGAAQAIPGPLFSFAAYLGAIVRSTPHGLGGAALGLVGIFLPGFLVLLAALPYWQALRQRAGARAMMAGVNAAVVGILAAALYVPLWTTSVKTAADLGVVVAGFALLTVWRVAPLLVVLASALAALAIAVIRTHPL